MVSKKVIERPLGDDDQYFQTTQKSSDKRPLRVHVDPYVENASAVVKGSDLHLVSSEREERMMKLRRPHRFEERDETWTPYLEKREKKEAWQLLKNVYSISGTSEDIKQSFLKPSIEIGVTSTSAVNREKRDLQSTLMLQCNTLSVSDLTQENKSEEPARTWEEATVHVNDLDMLTHWQIFL